MPCLRFSIILGSLLLVFSSAFCVTQTAHAQDNLIPDTTPAQFKVVMKGFSVESGDFQSHWAYNCWDSSSRGILSYGDVPEVGGTGWGIVNLGPQAALQLYTADLSMPPGHYTLSLDYFARGKAQPLARITTSPPVQYGAITTDAADGPLQDNGKKKLLVFKPSGAAFKSFKAEWTVKDKGTVELNFQDGAVGPDDGFYFRNLQLTRTGDGTTSSSSQKTANDLPPLSASQVTGAQIDESAVRATIIVTPATLKDGMQKAHNNLAAGVATKVVFEPGTYREDLSGLVWDQGRSKDTLLVLEGTPGKSVWTGADVFPLLTWKKQGVLLVHDWPYTFGNSGPFWGAKKLIADRSEMAFVNGQALRQEILETYKINGQTDEFKGGAVTFDYLALRDPQKTLAPGTFGVTEQAVNGSKVYVKLPIGITPTRGSLELSVRRTLVNFGTKHNLVVRGLDFVRCATPQPGFTSQDPLNFTGHGTDGPQNILIDRCRFLWNSGSGLDMGGDSWTIKHSVFDYNGFGGIGGGGCRNILFAGNDTSFNCWRDWRGGETGWSFGGVKISEIDGQKVIDHTAIGNCTIGLWWDIYCSNVDISDSVSLANPTTNIQWELSTGPFHGNRLVCGGSKIDSAISMINIGDCQLDNSILYQNASLVDNDDKGAKVAYLLSYPRDDPHANRHPIQRGIYALNHCLIVGGPRMPLTVSASWWGDDLYHFTVKGAGNIYYSPRGDRSFREHLNNGGMYTATYAEYAPIANDTGGRFLDPKLRDPDHYDFRLALDSPLIKDAARYPAYIMPATRLRELQAFYAWLRVGPEGPLSPPNDDL